MSDIAIEAFNPSHLPHLEELFRNSFQLGDPLLNNAYIRWFYAGNPFGLAQMVIAIEGTRWIGFMAMISARLVRRDAQLPGYCVVNVVVRPDYRGRNIFGRMITAAIDLVTAESALLIGYPNAMALKAWRRAGMHFQGPLKPCFVLPTLSVKRIHAHDVKDIDALRSSINLVQEQAMHADRWSLSLSSAYIDWRYLQHPVNTYRI